MTIRSKEVLRQIIELHTAGRSWKAIAEAVGVSASVPFIWLRASADAERNNQMDSDYWMDWPLNDFDWFHRKIFGASRVARALAVESACVDECINGRPEPVIENGRLVYAIDPELEALGFTGPNAWLYRDGKPVVLTRNVPAPATLRIAILGGLLPGTYSTKREQKVEVTPRSVLVVGDPLPPGSPKPQLRKPSNIPMTPIEKDLRERLAKLDVNRPRPRPEGGKANLGLPPPTGDADDQPTRTSGEIDRRPSPPTPRDPMAKRYELPEGVVPSMPMPSQAPLLDRVGYGSKGNEVMPGGFKISGPRYLK
jgi:hypothetical protein